MHLINLLCFLTLVAREATTLSCNHCFDEFGWDSCTQKNRVAQCGYILTNDLHRNLQNLNPSLPDVPPRVSLVWRCYELAVQFSGDQGQRLYERGCTYVEANFCNGWNVGLLQPSINCTLSTRGVPDVNDGGVDEGSGTEQPTQPTGGTGKVGQNVWGWLLAMFSVIFLAAYSA
ncbi:uncharacterized protein LOC115268718 [Aedes albopictus]|uniref:Uncharacterized protein n=1 Tax=Aedes albopictus TaxID=7160 RepID=A0ABM1Y9H8_AEDAL